MDKPFGRIVVPLDGSDLARAALPPAVALARHVSVPITLYANVLSKRDSVDAESELLSQAEAFADDLVIEVEVAQSDYGAARGILDEAHDGALICMASHGHGGVGQMLLGSVTEEVLRSSSTPVLVVGPHIDPDRAVTSGAMLACLDGSTFSEAVLPAATSWSTGLDLSLWLTSVIDLGAVSEVQGMVSQGDVFETGYLHRIAADLPVKADYEVLHDRFPAHAIASFADRLPAAIVAVATHGRTGWRRVAIGSVAMSIVHRARCPVLIVAAQPEGS